jgi:hypothetical protein
MEPIIAVVMELRGPTYMPKGDADIVALIPGVQVLEGKLAKEAFEASRLGYVLTVAEFIAQPIALARSYLAKGLSIEARDLLLSETLKPALKAELEAFA